MSEYKKTVTIKIYNSNTFDPSRRWFDAINDESYLETVEGPALGEDPRYADRGWTDSVPHPQFIKAVEAAYPGQTFVYYDGGMTPEKLKNFN